MVRVDTMVKVKLDLLDVFFNFPADFSCSEPESKFTHVVFLDRWFKHQRLWTSQTGTLDTEVRGLTGFGAKGSLQINVAKS